MELTELKEYLRIDTDAEDTLLMSMQDAAVDYLSAAGIPQQDTERYKLAVKGLVLHFYDHRDDSEPVGRGVQLLINQLKLGGTETDGNDS